MNFPILSSLILLPTVGALFLFFTKDKEGNNSTAKYVALFTTIVNFLISIYLWISFDQSTSNFQFVEDRTWIEGFINYKVGVDGISILFIILTTFITPLCIISVNNSVKNRLISRIKNRMLGVLVTTSYVSDNAYKEVRLDNHPVVFITGIDIVNILREKKGIATIESLENWLKKLETHNR